MNVVAENMSDYKVISGKEIQIMIEEGKENKEKAKRIVEVLPENRTYNVKIGYSKDGYVKIIDISAYEKEN